MLLGGSIGVLVAVLVLWIGLWATLFVLLMGAGGAVLGRQRQTLALIWEWLRQHCGP